MRISILGASGKVGTELLQQIKRSDDLSLVEAISTGRVGTDITDLAGAHLADTDVIVDFSAPDATMALFDRLAESDRAVVVGTTGFSEAQAKRLESEGARRPILVGANFTKGFEAFAAAARGLAKALPDATLTVGEIYNARKKAAPSGTTKRLCRELGAGRARPVETEIGRIGDTPGVNRVTLDYGVATIQLELTVISRAAYAAGALDAACWLAGRQNGFYQPIDMLS